RRHTSRSRRRLHPKTRLAPGRSPSLSPTQLLNGNKSRVALGDAKCSGHPVRTDEAGRLSNRHTACAGKDRRLEGAAQLCAEQWLGNGPVVTEGAVDASASSTTIVLDDARGARLERVNERTPKARKYRISGEDLDQSTVAHIARTVLLFLE